MIGSIVSIVAAARTEVGVTDPAAFFIASTEFPWFVTEDNNFISSYCKVVVRTHTVIEHCIKP